MVRCDQSVCVLGSRFCRLGESASFDVLLLINLKLRNRLAIGFGLVILFTFIVVAVAIYGMSRFADDSAKLYKHPYAASNTARDIGLRIMAMQRAMKELFESLQADFSFPALVVQHLHPTQNRGFVDILKYRTAFKICEARDKPPIKADTVYFAPPDCHMQIEHDFTVSLSHDEKVNCSCPSINVLFESVRAMALAEIAGELNSLAVDKW